MTTVHTFVGLAQFSCNLLQAETISLASEGQISHGLVNELHSVESRDGSAKKYSNKSGRDDDKYNRHPYIMHTHIHITTPCTVLSLSCGAAEDVCV